MGVGGAQNWKAEKKYKANSLVYTNEKLYICMEDHTSGTDFATDLLSGKWKFIGNGVGSNVVTKDLINNKYTIASVGSTTDIAVEDISDYDYLIVSVSLGSIHLERTIKNKGETHESKDYDIEYTNVSDNSYFIIRFNISDKQTIKVKLLTRSNNWSSYPVAVNSIVGIKIQELTTDYIASLSMPSDVYEEISFNFTTSVTEISQPYIASADGVLVHQLRAEANKKRFTLGIFKSNSYMGVHETVSTDGVSYGYTAIAMLPLRKGEQANLYLFNPSKQSLSDFVTRFYYTVGSAKALGLID